MFDFSEAVAFDPILNFMKQGILAGGNIYELVDKQIDNFSKRYQVVVIQDETLRKNFSEDMVSTYANAFRQTGSVDQALCSLRDLVGSSIHDINHAQLEKNMETQIVQEKLRIVQSG